MTALGKNQLGRIAAGLVAFLLGCGERRDTLLRAWPGMTYAELLHESTSLDANSFPLEVGASSDLHLLRGTVSDFIGGIPFGTVKFGPGYASVTLDRMTVKSIEFVPDAAEAEPRRSMQILANLNRAGFRTELGTATEGFHAASQRAKESLTAAGHGERIVRESLALHSVAGHGAILELAATRAQEPGSEIGVRIEAVRFESFR